MSNGSRLSSAIDRLAEVMPYGDLMAATDPAGFVDQVVDEVKRLRTALKAIADQGFELPENGTALLCKRSDFDTEMAEWGLGLRDKRPTI